MEAIYRLLTEQFSGWAVELQFVEDQVALQFLGEQVELQLPEKLEVPRLTEVEHLVEELEKLAGKQLVE